MIVIAGEIVVWMVLAAALGLGAGWALWGLGPSRPRRGAPSDEEVRELRDGLIRAKTEAAEREAELATLRRQLAGGTRSTRSTRATPPVAKRVSSPDDAPAAG